MAKFVEYTGEVITDQKPKKDEFKKGPGGFEVGTIEDQNQDLGNDWWQLPAALAAGGMLTEGARRLWNAQKDKSGAVAPVRVDPTFDMPPPPAAQPSAGQTNLTLKDVQDRLTAYNAQKTAAPQAVAPSAAPVSSVQPPAVPNVETAVATGGNVSQAVQQIAAKELDKAAGQSGGFLDYIKKAEALTQPVGSVPPKTRRTAAQTAIKEAERPMNAGFNQFSEMVGGKNNPVEMLKAWEDLHSNVWKGQLPIGQSGKMQFADETANYLKSNPDKYPGLVRHMEEREAAAMARKAAVPPGQAGFVTTQMPTKLTPFGQGVANVGRQVVGDLKMGAAMIPFALATDVRQQDIGFQRELQQQLKIAKDPERIKELQDEIQKLDDRRYLKAMYDRMVKKNVPAPFRPELQY